MKGKDSWSGFEVRVVARVWGVESADVEAPRLRHDPDEQEACFGKQLRRRVKAGNAHEMARRGVAAALLAGEDSEL